MQRFKTMLFLLTGLLVGKALKAQPTYYIAHIQGIVTRVSDNRKIAVGDTINPLEKLLFKTKSDFLSVISRMGGTRIVSGQLAAPDPSKNGFIATVKDLMLPSVSIKTLAIRSGTINSLLDFEKYCNNFSDSLRLLVVSSRKIRLNPNGFPDRNNRFFYIEYPYKNEVVSKKILFQEPSKQNDSLFVLLGSYLYEVDGRAIERDAVDTVRVYYYNAIEKKSTFLSNTRLNYISTAALLKELQVVKTVLTDKHESDPQKNDKIKSELREYITFNFGLIDEPAFLSLLTQLGI